MPPATSFEQFLADTADEPIYLILGVQGSGTNLVTRMLTRVFGFSVLRDRSMVVDAAVRLGPHPSAADAAREIAAFRAIVQPSTFARKTRKVIRQNESFWHIEDALTPAAVTSGAQFARLVYGYRAWSLGTRRMAIKSDDLWQHVDQLDSVIPNRRVLLLTRDFRDNLISIGGKAFGPVEPLRAAQYVKAQLARYAKEYRRQGSRGLHVRYEDLLSAPRAFVDTFAAHFGLEPVTDPDAALATIPIRPNKVAKWKRLDRRQLAWCEGLLQDELRTFGYQPECSPVTLPGPATLLAAAGRDTIKRVPQKIRRVVRRLTS
jgi:hypothetical protein